MTSSRLADLVRTESVSRQGVPLLPVTSYPRIGSLEADPDAAESQHNRPATPPHATRTGPRAHQLPWFLTRAPQGLPRRRACQSAGFVWRSLGQDRATPRQARKDVLAMAVYRLTLRAVKPVESAG